MLTLNPLSFTISVRILYGGGSYMDDKKIFAGVD